MLRISVIATLFFYLTISVGVHIDVDTCCKSITDISLTSSDKEAVKDESCCMATEMSCCKESGQEDCTFNSIFFQILAEEQALVNSPRCEPMVLDLWTENLFPSIDIQEINTATASNAEGPPLIRQELDLFLQYHSLVTYG